MACLDPSNFSLALCRSIGASSAALASLAARKPSSALDKVSVGGLAVLQAPFPRTKIIIATITHGEDALLCCWPPSSMLLMTSPVDNQMSPVNVQYNRT